MLIAVASRKASPGVTTLAALLAAQWPANGAPRLVLEADASGGSLAARWSAAHGVTWDPGLLTLSTSRRALDAALLPAVAQPLADGLWLAAAPPGADQVAAALHRLGRAGAASLSSADVITVADCGRLSTPSPALELARQAALTLLVCRPRLDEVHALVPAVEELRAAGCRLGLVTVGRRPYRPAEVGRSLGVDVVGVLADEPGAADRFARNGFGAGRSFTRSALADSAAEVTAAAHALCGPLQATVPLGWAHDDQSCAGGAVGPADFPDLAEPPAIDDGATPVRGPITGPHPLAPPFAGSAMPLSPAVVAARSVAAATADAEVAEVAEAAEVADQLLDAARGTGDSLGSDPTSESGQGRAKGSAGRG